MAATATAGTPDSIQAAIPVGLAGSNIASNPGFETGTASGWTVSGGTVLAASTNFAHSGSYSGQITPNGSGNAEILLSPNPTLILGQSYTWSFWVYMPSGQGVTTMNVTSETVASAATTTIVSLGVNTWTQITHTFIATTATVQVLLAYSNANMPLVYIDDAYLGSTSVLTATASVTPPAVTAEPAATQNLTATATLTGTSLLALPGSAGLTALAILNAGPIPGAASLTALADFLTNTVTQSSPLALAASAAMNTPDITQGMGLTLTATAALSEIITLIYHVGPALNASAFLLGPYTVEDGAVPGLAMPGIFIPGDGWVFSEPVVTLLSPANLSVQAAVNSPNSILNVSEALTALTSITADVTRSVIASLTAAGAITTTATQRSLQSLSAYADFLADINTQQAVVNLAAAAAMNTPDVLLKIAATNISATAALSTKVTLIQNIVTALTAQAALHNSSVTQGAGEQLFALAGLTNYSTIGVTDSLSAAATIADVITEIVTGVNLTAAGTLAPYAAQRSGSVLAALTALTNAATQRTNTNPLTAAALLTNAATQNTSAALAALAALTSLVTAEPDATLAAAALLASPDSRLVPAASLVASPSLHSSVLLRVNANPLASSASLANVPAISSFSALAAAAGIANPRVTFTPGAYLQARAVEKQLIQFIYSAYMDIVWDVLMSVNSTFLDVEWNVGAPLTHPRKLTQEGWTSMVQTGKKVGT